MLPSASRLGPRAGGPVQRRVPPGCLGPSHLPQAALFLFHLCPLREEGDSLREASPRGRGSPARLHGPARGRVQPTTIPRACSGWVGSEEGGPWPPGLSPPPGGLLGWPQTHSLDTREGRAVCRSGHVSLCGYSPSWGTGPRALPTGEALLGLLNRDRRCHGGRVTAWCWTSPGCPLQPRQCRHKDPAAEGPFVAPALVTGRCGAGLGPDSGAVSGGVPGQLAP